MGTRDHSGSEPALPRVPSCRAQSALSWGPLKVFLFLFFFLRDWSQSAAFQPAQWKGNRSTGIKGSRYIHADERGRDAERRRKPASRERPPGPGPNRFLPWGRGWWREGAGGRSTWQEEMITAIRSIMRVIMSMIKKKNSDSLFGEPEHACRRHCTAGGGGRGEGEERRRQRLWRQHPPMNNNNAQRKLRFSLKIQPSA